MMGKPALGRGLGELMRPAEGQDPEVASPQPESVPERPTPGPGLHTLLQGHTQPQATPPPPVQQSAVEERIVEEPVSLPWAMRFVLVIADILLVVIAFFLILNQKGPPSRVDWVLAVTALTMGAILSSLAWTRYTSRHRATTVTRKIRP